MRSGKWLRENIAQGSCQLLVTAALLAIATAGTTTEKTASVAQAITDETVLQECGASEVRALRFIRVARARLAMASCGDDHLKPPLELSFAYSRKVPADAFSRSAWAMLERNLTAAQLQPLEHRLRAINNAYLDTEAGDVYRLIYRENGVFQLFLNQQKLAEDQGHELARAYLSIWFGERPYSPELRAALLGLNR